MKEEEKEEEGRCYIKVFYGEAQLERGRVDLRFIHCKGFLQSTAEGCRLSLICLTENRNRTQKTEKQKIHIITTGRGVDGPKKRNRCK